MKKIKDKIKNLLGRIVVLCNTKARKNFESSEGVGKMPEFFLPDSNLKLEDYLRIEDAQGIHHLGRYHWAKMVIEKIPHARILDIACGAGFGTDMLAEAFSDCEILGADYDQRGVDLAKKKYSRQNLKFSRGNIITWQLENEGKEKKPLGEFDVIISFDTLEHLLHREIAMENIVNNLKEDGHLLLSTPCSHGDTTLSPGWEHHKIEYSYCDLYDFLKRYFQNVQRADDRTLPALDFWQNVINKDEIRYINKMNPVVCSDPIKIQNDQCKEK